MHTQIRLSALGGIHLCHFTELCLCEGAEPVVIRNLKHSLRLGPSPCVVDLGPMQNGASQGDSSSTVPRKRTRVGDLISGTG